jgi:hypothetical protein
MDYFAYGCRILILVSFSFLNKNFNIFAVETISVLENWWFSLFFYLLVAASGASTC